MGKQSASVTYSGEATASGAAAGSSAAATGSGAASGAAAAGASSDLATAGSAAAASVFASASATASDLVSVVTASAPAAWKGTYGSRLCCVYVRSATSAKCSKVTLRLSLRVDVSSPPSTEKSCGKMVNFLMVEFRLGASLLPSVMQSVMYLMVAGSDMAAEMVVTSLPGISQSNSSVPAVSHGLPFALWVTMAAR